MTSPSIDDPNGLATFFRNYGPAIGPALAFLFGIVALYIKDAFDRRQRMVRSKRLLAHFTDLALTKPPEWIPVPKDSGHRTGDAHRGNYIALDAYHGRLLAARSFLVANEKQLVEDAPLDVIDALYARKWRFERILECTERGLQQDPSDRAGALHHIEGFYRALARLAGRSLPKSIEEAGLFPRGIHLEPDQPLEGGN